MPSVRDLRQRFVILFVFNHQCGGRGLRSGKNEPYQTVTFRSGEHESRLGQVPWFGCRADACIVFQPILVIDASPAMLLHRKTCPVVLMNAQVRLVNAELTRLVEREPQADCGISTAAILRGDAIAYMPGSDTQIVVQAMPQIEDSHIRTLIIDENVLAARHPARLQPDATRLFFKLMHIHGEPLAVHAGRLVLEPVLVRRKLREQLNVRSGSARHTSVNRILALSFPPY